MFCFSLLCLPLIKEAFHLPFDLQLFLFYQILKPSMRPCVFVSVFFFPLQYASVGKNDESFMSPQDFVSHFLHAHTDIQLSDEATNLLARVVDQNKEVGVLMSFPIM